MIFPGDLVFVKMRVGGYLLLEGLGLVLEASSPDIELSFRNCQKNEESHWWVFMNNEPWNVSSKYIKKIKTRSSF